MDLHPPQGAHTSHLRTLSKIKGLRVFVQPTPEDLSSKGAAYYTTNSRTVNTFDAKFLMRRDRFLEPGAFVADNRLGLASKGRES
jgi:hypothetical protein